MPTRNEILGTLSLGFLLSALGVVWMFGAVGLISCGIVVFLVGLLLGFLPQDKKKEGSE